MAYVFMVYDRRNQCQQGAGMLYFQGYCVVESLCFSIPYLRLPHRPRLRLRHRPRLHLRLRLHFRPRIYVGVRVRVLVRRQFLCL